MFTLSAALLQYSMCLVVLIRQQHRSFPQSGARDTTEAVEDVIKLFDVAVERHLLSM